MKNPDVSTVIWSFFLSVTLQAAVHLGFDHTENLRYTKSQPKKSLRHLFQVNQKLNTDLTEITGLTTIDWQQRMWRETTLLTELFSSQLQKPTSFLTRCYVWESSVLDQSKAWERKIKWFLETRYFKELDRIDGEHMEFEWKNFTGFTALNSRRDPEDNDF